jgi:hypothetical protein
MSSGNTKCKAESVKRKWKRNCDGKYKLKGKLKREGNGNETG